MSKINSGLVWAEPLTEAQLNDARKRVLENGEAVACIDPDKELCFLMPTEPMTIKELAWNRAEKLHYGNTSDQPHKDVYRKSGVDGYYFEEQWYCPAWNVTPLPFNRYPTAPPGLTVTGSLITGYDSTRMPESGICYIPAYVNGVKITGIYDGALFGCDKITYVNIPPTVTYIGVGAFNNCANLINIDIGNCEAAYGMYTSENGIQPATPFTKTSALQAFSVASDNKKYKSVDGVLFEILNSGWLSLVAYPAGKPDAAYTVPQNVAIKSCAFWGCTNLTTVNLQDAGMGTARDVFYHCDNLTDIISTKTRSNFTYSSYGTTYWWQPSDSSKTVTIHCSDGTLTAAVAPDGHGYTYN